MTGRGPPIPLCPLVDAAEARDAGTCSGLDLRSGEVLDANPDQDLGPEAARELEAAIERWEADPAVRALPDARQAQRRAAIAAWLRAWLDEEGVPSVEDLDPGAAETRDR